MTFSVLNDDYAPSTLQVTFPEHSRAGDTVCEQIFTINDQALECTHDFTVRIVGATLGTMIGAPSEAVISILDNDGKYL